MTNAGLMPFDIVSTPYFLMLYPPLPAHGQNSLNFGISWAVASSAMPGFHISILCRIVPNKAQFVHRQPGGVLIASDVNDNKILAVFPDPQHNLGRLMLCSLVGGRDFTRRRYLRSPTTALRGRNAKVQRFDWDRWPSSQSDRNGNRGAKMPSGAGIDKHRGVP